MILVLVEEMMALAEAVERGQMSEEGVPGK